MALAFKEGMLCRTSSPGSWPLQPFSWPCLYCLRTAPGGLQWVGMEMVTSLVLSRWPTDSLLSLGTRETDVLHPNLLPCPLYPPALLSCSTSLPLPSPSNLYALSVSVGLHGITHWVDVAPQAGWWDATAELPVGSVIAAG